jgi:hypothetical protein
MGNKLGLHLRNGVGHFFWESTANQGHGGGCGECIVVFAGGDMVRATLATCVLDRSVALPKAAVVRIGQLPK